MGSSRGLVMWVVGFTGVFLIYCAYKNKSPVDVFVNALRGDGATAADIEREKGTWQSIYSQQMGAPGPKVNDPGTPIPGVPSNYNPNGTPKAIPA